MAEPTKVWIVERAVEWGILEQNANRRITCAYWLAVDVSGRLRVIVPISLPFFSAFDPHNRRQGSPVEVMDG